MAERTLGALAERFGVEVRGDPALVLRRVASLESAQPGDLTFVAQPKYLARLPQCRASAVILAPKFADRAPPHLALVLAPDPYLLYAKAAQWLHPEPEVCPGVHPSAVVLGEVDPSCAIGPNAVVEAGARVGARERLGPVHDQRHPTLEVVLRRRRGRRHGPRLSGAVDDHQPVAIASERLATLAAGCTAGAP